MSLANVQRAVRGESDVTDELFCLFKSSRRLEYTQENLRILSGAIGDEVEVSYSERWLSEDVVRQLARVDDPVLIALSDPPYGKSQPVRMARIDSVYIALLHQLECDRLGEGGKLLEHGVTIYRNRNRDRPLTRPRPPGASRCGRPSRRA